MEGVTTTQPLAAIAGNICWKCRSPKLNGPSRRATKPENPAKCDLDSLPACGACKRVKYCCPECQKSDWPQHKRLCKTFRILNTRIESEPHKHPYEFAHPALPEQFWVTMQRERIQLFRELYGAGGQDHDRPLLYAPRCFYCLRSPFHGITLQPCSGCRIVTACADHWPALRATHTPEKCKDWEDMAYLELCREDFLRTMGEPGVIMANAKIEPVFNGLPDTDWVGYLTWRANDFTTVPGDIPRHLMDACTETASSILTIIAALQHVIGVDGLNTLKTLTVHIISTDGMEFMSARIYEEALHLLPNLKKVDVIVIGEELAASAQRGALNRTIALDCCPHCSRAGKTRSIRLIPKTYDDFFGSPGYKKPDLIASFNLGLAEQPPAEALFTWRPLIADILDLNVPVVMTAFNEGEAKADQEYVGAPRPMGVGARMLLEAQPNRWRSRVPVPEPEVGKGDLFWKNAWWFVFQGKRD